MVITFNLSLIYGYQAKAFLLCIMHYALCLMLSKTYYTQNYTGIIGLGLITVRWIIWICYSKTAWHILSVFAVILNISKCMYLSALYLWYMYYTTYKYISTSGARSIFSSTLQSYIVCHCRGWCLHHHPHNTKICIEGLKVLYPQTQWPTQLAIPQL